MTLTEFKHWFDGVVFGIERPTKEQWQQIKEKLAEVEEERIPFSTQSIHSNHILTKEI